MAFPQSGSWSTVPDQIGILQCWFLQRGLKPENTEKNSRSKDKNQQQTQTTYDTESRNWTQVTMVGGKRSRHCAIPAPLTTYIL